MNKSEMVFEYICIPLIISTGLYALHSALEINLDLCFPSHYLIVSALWGIFDLIDELIKKLKEKR